MRPVRFVALGDSLTEGVGDPVGAGWRGWAALLAASLAEDSEHVRFTNLAVSGRRPGTCWSGRRRPPWRCAPTWRPSSSASTTRCAALSTSTPWRRTSTRSTRPSPGRAPHCSPPVCPTPVRCSGSPDALAQPAGPPATGRQRGRARPVRPVRRRPPARGGRRLDQRPDPVERGPAAPGERGHRQLAVRCHALLAETGRATGQAALGRAGVPRADPHGEPVVAGHGRDRLGAPALHRSAAAASCASPPTNCTTGPGAPAPTWTCARRPRSRRRSRPLPAAGGGVGRGGRRPYGRRLHGAGPERGGP